MNVQKIQGIRQAEQTAQDILTSAEEQINTILRDASTKAVQIVESQKQQSREQELKILSEYQTEGLNKSKTILSELDRELENINVIANTEEKKAISFVTDQMKVSYGN